MAARMESACGVHFVWDFAADGLHRPSRTFEAWLRIPRAYGGWDAKRVRAGQITQEGVCILAASRNRGTRFLTRLLISLPFLSPLIIWSLKSLSVIFYRRGAFSPAVAVLSGLYNAAYMQAFTRSLHAVEGDPGKPPIPSRQSDNSCI